MMVARTLRRNRKMTITTRPMVSISSNCTSSTEARMVVVRSVRMSTLNGGGQRGLQLRQQLLDAIDDGDDVRAGLPLNIQNDRGIVVHPRGLLDIFGAIDHGGHVGEPHRRAVAIGDDERTVAVARRSAGRWRRWCRPDAGRRNCLWPDRRWPGPARCANPPGSGRRRPAPLDSPECAPPASVRR